MSSALVKEKLIAAISSRHSEPATTLAQLTSVYKQASEKLGVFTIQSCACQAAKAAACLQSNQRELAESEITQCLLNLDGVIGDEKINLLQLVLKQALTALQDLSGNKLTTDCFDNLKVFYQQTSKLVWLAKQFTMQCLKTSILFNQTTNIDALSTVSGILNSSNDTETLLYESLLYLSLNDYKSAQKELEQYVYLLEEQQAPVGQMLLPVLAIAYCFMLQSKPESALTYVYWAADLAKDVYPTTSAEFYELQAYAGYYALDYDSHKIAEKYFANIAKNTEWQNAPSEFLLACFELKKIRNLCTFQFSDVLDQSSNVDAAHMAIINSEFPNNFDWDATQQSTESAQKTYDFLIQIKARYTSDLNPRLLLLIDLIQKNAAAENLYLAAEMCA